MEFTHPGQDLVITIETSKPKEHIDTILQTLAASIRWYAFVNEEKLQVDAAALFELSDLIEGFTKAEINGHTVLAVIETTDPAEKREMTVKALMACIKWYAILGDKNCLRTCNNEDGNNLNVLIDLVTCIRQSQPLIELEWA